MHTSKDDDEYVAISSKLAPVHNIEDKHKFKFFIQHSGKCSEQNAEKRLVFFFMEPNSVLMCYVWWKYHRSKTTPSGTLSATF